MDQSNVENIKAINPSIKGQLFKLLEFSNMKESDVPDPYYTNNFEGVYKMVQSSCDNLIDYIVKDANLKEGKIMENKFIPGVLLGAVIGGVATLADKSTRNSLKQSFSNVKEGKNLKTF